MIKCTVTLTGEVSRTAATRAGRDGKSFTSFGVSIPVYDKNNNSLTTEVSVSLPSEKMPQSIIQIGKRVKVTGTLYFRKVEESIYLNLHATSVLPDFSEIDELEGEMEFLGRMSRKPVTERRDKKNRPFQSFSASSMDSNQNPPTFIWVHFLNFRPVDWLAPGVGLKIRGRLDLHMFNDRLDVGCTTSSIEKWTADEKEGTTK